MFEKPSNEGCRDLVDLFDLWDCALDGGLDIPVKIDFTAARSDQKMTYTTSDTAPLLDNEALQSSDHQTTRPVFDYCPSQYSEGSIFIIEVPESRSDKGSIVSWLVRGVRRLFGRTL